MRLPVGARIALACASTGLACTSWPTWPNSIPQPSERLDAAEDLASRSGFERVAWRPEIAREGAPSARPSSTGPLPVSTWVGRADDEAGVNVYIEGDGLAWRTRHLVSEDPTPIRATGLMLAAADPSQATVFYVARPCQYDARADPRCSAGLWTQNRFGEAVVSAVDHRITTLLEEFASAGEGRAAAGGRERRRLTLIGYSGGGVVAALVAARRDDIDLLVTLSAPLDVDRWTRTTRVSPLKGSLSPMHLIDRLRSIPQVHFVGVEDRIVPPAVTESFHRAVEGGGNSRFVIVPDMDHRHWPTRWDEITESMQLFEPAPAPAPTPTPR